MMLLPKEHGVYGQLAFPLSTALLVSGANAPAWLLACGLIAAFMTHEPLMVYLGRRGARVRHAARTRATVWLGVTGVAAAIASVLAFASAAPPTRWAFAVPLVPALAVAWAIWTNREKTVVGEVAVALVFSFAALPLCVVAGAPIGRAVGLATTFALIFVTATLAVRVIILGVRAGGNAVAVQRTRGAVLTIVAMALVGLGAASRQDVLPQSSLIASTPGLLTAAWVALHPPPPARLRAVGWTLVFIATLAAAILVTV